MQRIQKKDWLIFAIQAAVWASILLLPSLTTYVSTQDIPTSKNLFVMLWNMLRSPFLLYFINFYVLAPWLLYKKRNWLFVLVNIVLFLALNYRFFYMRRYMPQMPREAWSGFFAGLVVFVLLNVVTITAAVGIRHYLRNRKMKQQLKDERAKNTEAELAWLKNQINPHFLFNTLNNISSLTQIDADAAQDAIAQLSDLLRYAMYETNKQMVPLSGEIEFMRNYIGLMQLRCNEKTVVNTQFSIENAQQEVAPLLFISLVENAFKHGVSSSRPSSIDISLSEHDGVLSFVCDNTNYPKSDEDRSGSGIGLENTRRRLQLIYGERYTWEQSLENDIYHIKININT